MWGVSHYFDAIWCKICIFSTRKLRSGWTSSTFAGELPVVGKLTAGIGKTPVWSVGSQQKPVKRRGVVRPSREGTKRRRRDEHGTRERMQTLWSKGNERPAAMDTNQYSMERKGSTRAQVWGMNLNVTCCKQRSSPSRGSVKRPV